MSYLVDTHILLWTIFSPKKISKNVRQILLDPQQSKYVSTLTFWEISLKYQLGKLELWGILPDELPNFAKESDFEILNLDAEMASSFYKLPKQKNKDPFDRMLAWQAIASDHTLLTKDPDFADYNENGLKTIW